VLIRRERPTDTDQVASVVAAAFAEQASLGDEPMEVGLLHALRSDPGWIPALSLVAVDPDTDTVLGSVVCSRGRVDDLPAVGLAPLAVDPGRQSAGVGSALIHTVLGAADALEEPLVALLGEPEYYSRFGFRPASEFQISAPDPDWGTYFQVRPLSAYRPLTGTFHYAAPFDEL
jgi:putative acetyltransferase